MRTLILLLLISIGCEAQITVSQSPLYYSQNQNYFIVGVIGDSNAVGFGGTAGPTTAAGTCFEWDDINTQLDELTTADLTGATNGSAWKQFALSHYTRTGQPVVFIQGAISGSSFYPNAPGGITNNWQIGPDGVCYDNWKDKMDNALAYLGRTQPDLIAGVLGINDEQGSVSTANFNTGVDAVMDQLDTDYPGVLKLWTQIGRWPTSSNSATLYDKRVVLITQIEAHSQHAMAASAIPYVFTTGYEADNVHYTTGSLNELGDSYDKYLEFNTVLNKWARGVLSSMFTRQTQAVFDAIDDFVTLLYDDGDYFTTEGCAFLISDDVYNTSVDYSFKNSFATVGGATFSANNYTRFDGANDFGGTGITPSFFDSGWSQDDHYFVLKVLDNRDGPTVGGGLFGGGNAASPFIGIGQGGASTTNYRANDATVTSYATLTAFADDKFYGVARNGTTKYFLDGSSVMTSVVQASTGLGARDLTIAGWNNAGTIQFHMDCDLQFYYAGKYTGLNLTTFLAAAQAVIDAH